ncbi:MAG: flagellar biosynthetic protein FliO [Desulfatitalea sp.]
MSAVPDLTAATLKMVLSLSAILLVLWAAQRWLRRALPAGAVGGRRRWIKVLGSHSMGMKKSIAMVQVPGAILVLGIGSDQIQLLTRIDDPDVMAVITAADTTGHGTMGFREQLRRVTRSLRGQTDGATASDDERAAF